MLAGVAAQAESDDEPCPSGSSGRPARRGAKNGQPADKDSDFECSMGASSGSSSEELGDAEEDWQDSEGGSDCSAGRGTRKKKKAAPKKRAGASAGGPNSSKVMCAPAQLGEARCWRPLCTQEGYA